MFQLMAVESAVHVRFAKQLLVAQLCHGQVASTLLALRSTLVQHRVVPGF
jgi:hypothetical protein